MSNSNKHVNIQNYKTTTENVVKKDQSTNNSTPINTNDRNNLEPQYSGRRHLEKHLFYKNATNVVDNYKRNCKDRLTLPLLNESELDIEGDSSKLLSSIESSRTLGSLCTSDIETNTSDITNNIRRLKSMRKTKDNKINFTSKDIKRRDLITTNDVPLNLTSKHKLCCDKTTYCQPVVNYNQEFIYKTMEKNNKLKRLVKQLLLTQKNAKEDVNWNKYINELKNKHSPYSGNSGIIMSSHKEQINSKMIEDCQNTKFCWKHSIPCSNLLEDWYGAYNIPQQTCTRYKLSDNRQSTLPKNHKYIPFENNLFCYPNCAQGRLVVLERQRRECGIRRSRQFNDRGINYNAFGDIKLPRKQINANVFSKNLRAKKLASTSIQTDILLYQLFVSKATDTQNLILNNKCIGVKNDVHDIAKSTEFDKGKNYCDNNLNNDSITKIEIKMETLIESINNFINEVKNRSLHENKCVSVSCNTGNRNKRVKETKELSMEPTRLEQIYTTATNSSRSTSTANVSILKLDHLASKEFRNKIISTDEYQNSVERKYLEKFKQNMNTPCSVQIQFEIPSRDCCTEVTKSLSNQRAGDKSEEIIASINSESHHQMTIAINTDPLSIFSLLRISTDAIRRFMSYVPNINYYWYLSMLQFPNVLRHKESHHVCNICGADFNKPSELSDHIQGHNLERTRDCCVCRHVLDRQRRSAGFFTCQYCGQKFTRAYCCDLHQQSCARRLGLDCDVSPSLTILR